MQVERTRGDTAPDVFTITFARTRGVVNLSGCTFKLTVSSEPDPVDSSAQAYQLDGVVTDPASGRVEFAPTASQADRVGYFYFDVQMTDSYGLVRTMVKDVYLYKQDITK